MSTEKVPLNLRAARRSLRDVTGVEILEDWMAMGSQWALRCRLSVPVQPGGLVPPSTDWFVLVGPSYPWDSLKVFPSKVNGITATFPHQLHNGEGSPDVPYREGLLCLNMPGYLLGRNAITPEPFVASGLRSRLSWHLQRAVGWLEAAAAGQLRRPGDPFELPAFPLAGGQRLTFVFQEGPDSFLRWCSLAEQFGLAELVTWAGQPRAVIMQRFFTLSGQELMEYSWGDAVRGATTVTRAAWLRLPAASILAPWQAPGTWGELRDACRNQRIDLEAILRRLFPRLRDGKEHLLLVGFPIPKVVDGALEQMHWSAIGIPPLSHGRVRLPGFRPGAPLAHWVEDQRNIVARSQSVRWQNSENWARHELGSRGHLPDNIVGRNVLLIGCGTVGSAVAELLVRAGLRRLTVMDDDTFQAGNLCRHTLLLSDVLESKAERIAARLRAASPHAQVVALNQGFPPQKADEHSTVTSCDLILDCTADDQVIRKLATFPWGERHVFASVWLGLRARRVYCFTAVGNTFPVVEFDRLVQPWLRQEAGEPGAGDLPREGVGCWHPVFPARADDVWLLASAAVKHLEGVLTAADANPRLAVFEQSMDGEGFTGLRRIPAEVQYA